MESVGLVEWPASALDSKQMPPKPFSAWCHFDREWIDSDEAVLRNLIRGGCRYLMITGILSDWIHDTADDAAISETGDLVLTTSSEFGESAAFEFVSIRCPEGPCLGRVLVVFSSDMTEELKRAAAMRRLVENNLD